MPYKTIELLGKGGFGEVYRAEDDEGYEVALKRFKPAPNVPVPEAQLLERFRREARYQRKIDHPNVVEILDEGTDDEGAFFVMELADTSLKKYLEANPELSHEERVRIIEDILDGLEAVHKNNCTHRDLKPENILVFEDDDADYGYRFALSDFGLVAPPTNAETTLTMTGMAGGSTYYASPEAMKSMNRCDARSDIYAVGCIIYDLFYGKPRVPLDHLKVPGEIGRVVYRCTETNPSKRYQSVAELREDFVVAADIEEWSPSSPIEQRYLDILSGDAPSEDEWDEIDMSLQEMLQQGTIKEAGYPIFRAMRSDHFDQVKGLSDGVFKSIAKGMTEHVIACRGWYSFDYCDIIAVKLRRIVTIGSPEEAAGALVALLVLGVSHNRFAVEKIFGRECGAGANEETIQRFLIEMEARDLSVSEWLDRWRDSLAAPPELHPLVVDAWTT